MKRAHRKGEDPNWEDHRQESPLPGEENEDENGRDNEGSLTEEQFSRSGRRTRRKIKIRKRVRIKRKVSPKKKIKRILELIAWILVFASFIVTIVILILQLDLNSKHRNKKSVYNQQTFPDYNPVQWCEVSGKTNFAVDCSHIV